MTRSFSDDKYGVVQQNLGEIITIIIKLQKVSMCAEYLYVQSQFSMDMLIGIHSWKKNNPPEVEDVKLDTERIQSSQQYQVDDKS